MEKHLSFHPLNAQSFNVSKAGSLNDCFEKILNIVNPFATDTRCLSRTEINLTIFLSFFQKIGEPKQKE
jgi:hypothetical protein